ncbi:MAG: TonB-dependent receptor plug domain-containing protein [Opitutae bacterium]|nr:TonB-dependent receptor plug domain-containing protein [Opitutae bacterium]
MTRRRRSPLVRRLVGNLLRVSLLCLVCRWPAPAHGAPVAFDLAAQPAPAALLEFSQQARIEVLFSFDALAKVQTTAVAGRYEPAVAVNLLLQGTGYTARQNPAGKFLVTPDARATGSIRGRLLDADGNSARGVRVSIPDARQLTLTDEAGQFDFTAVPPGTYQLVAAAAGYQPLWLTNIRVVVNRVQHLPAQKLVAADEVTRLDPFVVVEAATGLLSIDRNRTTLAPRTATGNLDLHRTANDALPFTIYDREQITRSGVVDLNEFLQRALLDSDAGTPPPEQNGQAASFAAGSSNLNLRGYGQDQTVVLINGRRLPEVLTNESGGYTPPDVNFIPLSLVQQVEVLPVSASALYSGNAVGGVINIVLRSGADTDTTELTTTYTNALRGFDAPQTSVTLQHSHTLLDGKLRVRLSLGVTRALPPTESELGYRQARIRTDLPLDEAIFRATPNIRSADLAPLFGPGTSPVTSVAPGASGTGGLAAFAGRAGVRNFNLFDPPGGLAASLNSLDYPYARRQQRTSYFGSAVYDVTPWLQLGLDATYVRNIVNRGFDVFAADLSLPATNPLNPFHQDVNVSLNDVAPQLGEGYSKARLDFASVVGGALVKLPRDWQLSLDGQYAHSLVKFRSTAGADPARWQQLVDQGIYNPLRDTQVSGPPQQFYDRVLIYRGGPDRFVTLGNYDTLDGAVRLTNESLPLPTGRGLLNVGGDYRRTHLARFLDVRTFADGSLASDPIEWTGRTLQRLSVFGELQAPLLPARWLPGWLRGIEGDFAVRYIAADTSRETNIAPTYGLKVDLAGGLAVRGSFSTSNRQPTPQLSQPVLPAGNGPGANLFTVFDPRRNESYDIRAEDAPNPALRPEASVTQTAGVIFQRGKIHRLRASLDFVDTRKVSEVVVLDAKTVVTAEALFPGRVLRAPLAAGDPHTVGRVTSAITGAVNLAERHSQNWNASLDYAWTKCAGGMLEAYGRLVWFQRFDRQALPDTPPVDELGQPDGLAAGLLRYRANFGASWSNRHVGGGLDGHYYHSRILPVAERALQGDTQIKPFWQFDAYLQKDLTKWLPWKNSRNGLRVQLRVNNLFGTPFPKYVFDAPGAGVQAYGDWRGRTYSLSLTAVF